MLKFAKNTAYIMKLVHIAGAIVGAVILICVFLHGTFFPNEGSVFENVVSAVFKTGAFQDTETGKGVVREVNVYGLNIQNVYTENYIFDFYEEQNYETGETHSHSKRTISDYEYNTWAALIYTIGMIVIFAAMAFIFDCIYQSLQSAEKDSADLMKKSASLLNSAGYLLIFITFVILITSTLANMMAHKLLPSFNYVTFVMGLFLICLSKFFSYGGKLEDEVGELV